MGPRLDASVKESGRYATPHLAAQERVSRMGHRVLVIGG